MPPETWVTVPGSNGRYEVSDLGRVRSVGYGTGRRLRPSPLLMTPQPSKRGGYLTIRLHYRDSRRTVRVNRLILAAFTGQDPPDLDAAHLNGVRTDNRLCNLKWATRRENEEDKMSHGTKRCGEASNLSKLTTVDVQDIRAAYSRGGTTQAALAARYGVARRTVGDIISGRNWSHIREGAG